MIYMFKVFLVVAVPVFGLAGAVLLTMIACSLAKDYVRARFTMRRRISALTPQHRSEESLA